MLYWNKQVRADSNNIKTRPDEHRGNIQVVNSSYVFNSPLTLNLKQTNKKGLKPLPKWTKNSSMFNLILE